MIYLCLVGIYSKQYTYQLFNRNINHSKTSIMLLDATNRITKSQHFTTVLDALGLKHTQDKNDVIIYALEEL